MQSSPLNTMQPKKHVVIKYSEEVLTMYLCKNTGVSASMSQKNMSSFVKTRTDKG